MPYRPRALETMPEWIREMAGDDTCLDDVLTEAWVASQKAREAVIQRNGEVPRTCSDELEVTEGILDAIRDGYVPRFQLARKAAQAVRKFDMVRQCARFLERDNSPTFAQERRLRRRA